MFFSIIVPVYKVEKYLPDCIESVLNQTFSDFVWTDQEIDGSEELQVQISIWINKVLGKSAGYNDGYYYPTESFMLDMEKAGIKVEQAKSPSTL